MIPQTRQEKISELLQSEPKFRLKQIQESLFQPELKRWDDVYTLPQALRENLEKNVPFISSEPSEIKVNHERTTHKALLRLEDGEEIETVLMENSRGSFTICVSSQVGCAMKCAFCATGTLGLKRNLNEDEIVDQYRFWNTYILENKLEKRISNIVYMGMGEPLANYENVRASLNTILEKTDVGPTKIVVSTVGVIPRLEQILEDPDWPEVRMAISVHSADPLVRSKLMPSSPPDFLDQLSKWSKAYLEKFGNKNHHISFEYILLNDINDSKKDAAQLARYIKPIGNVRVNLIPYNFTDSIFTPSKESAMDLFQETLKKHSVTVTRRRSMGDDISAACGQLAKKSAC